ncbi:MAG TPA: ornithine cyclodeaminase family protein [Thermoanaerobaculia bacterium]|nr:ornithine cyclodeaminase family protein [Thermoanaerobaculia bacterium]
MSLLSLNRAEVEELLPMAECIEAVEAALRSLACQEAVQPLRSAHWMPDRHGLLVVMPGMLGGVALQGPESGWIAGVKVLTVVPENHLVGEESHQGLLLLFEVERGRPLALLDASAVTAIRTAAASAVATRALARPDAGDLALLGSGTQARSHLDALRCVRDLRRVRVWSRRPERARRFAAEESARTGLTVEPMPSARLAVEGADLICTVTAATEPVVERDWISPGAHVNAVGACTPNARELDAGTVAASRLFTDRRESLLAEAGDFLLARAEGQVTDDHISGELGDVLEGTVPGRRSGDEITLFKSLGIAVEDLAAGAHVYRKAYCSRFR